jgi:lipopolysaccharide biosynthesis glycosyltransferase
MAERTALYAATRNLYHDMVVCAKSLLCHNGADKVIFLIEDDEFPEPIPSCITTMNVSDQQYFNPSGSNFTSRWTYMALMRTALCYLLPDLDRVLSLDCDTIVNKPIDYLWDVDISNHYFAMVEEKQITNRTHPYFNFGVVIHNLAKLRDGTADTIIRTINTVPLQYCEQDAVNSVCSRHILELPQEYNAMFFNIPRIPDGEEVIKHYAAWRPFNTKPGYATYDALTWEQVMQMKEVNRIA